LIETIEALEKLRTTWFLAFLPETYKTQLFLLDECLSTYIWAILVVSQHSIINSFIMIRNRKLILFSVAIVSSLIMLSSSGGPDFATAGAPGDSFPSCVSCHSGSGGTVTLSGAPAAYSPGVTYPLTLTVFGAGATKGGFQIVATNASNNTQVGTFSVPSGTKLSTSPPGRLIQSTPLTLSSGSGSWSFNWTAPATGAPSNIRFYFAGNAANGINGADPGDKGVGGFSALIPLPVELTKFTGALNRESVHLYWQTATELNSDKFFITRSVDNRNFERIGQVDAAEQSTTTKNYTFTDTRLPDAKQLYYRLEQIDLDGTNTPSRIVSLRQAQSNTRVRFLDGNPMAWNGSVRFQVESADQANSARLLSIDGRLLGETAIIADAENEILINDLGQTMLILQILGADQSLLHTERVVRF
jgi:Reeler domain